MSQVSPASLTGTAPFSIPELGSMPAEQVHQSASAPVRSTRERIVQTLCFEGVALTFVVPIFAWLTGEPPWASLLLIGLISFVEMAWAALFHNIFDRVEVRTTTRSASERPHRSRIVHALLLEITGTLVTWPVIMLMTDLDWIAALSADLMLGAICMLYTYVFHLVFDRLRPVPATEPEPNRLVHGKAPEPQPD